MSIVSVVIYISSSQKYLQWFEEKGNKNAQKIQINVVSLLSVVQYTLDLRKPDLRKNLDLRKIVGATDFLVHKLFDLRKIF